ncbi:MAG: DNA polymerase III subunit beta, partial [Bacillota bacterium]
MKLTVDRDDLVSAVSAAVRGTAKQGAAMHVLSDVVLRAEGGQLHAMGTDLDIEISASVPAEVEAEGAIALPGRVFLELTRRLSGGSVRLEAIDGPGVCIEQGRSSFKLQGLDPERHPGGLAKAPEDSAVSIDGGLLAEVAAKTWPYVATDITRPVLTGVCIEADGENLQAVATDGFRMGIVARGGLKGVRIRRCVVPARALAEAARIVQPGEDVRVCVGESVISFETPAGRVAGRLIQGQYPDVLASIPANYPMRAVASRAELTEAVRRAALVAAMSPASWGSSRHTVTLDIRRGGIVVGAEARDAAEAREEMGAETPLGLHTGTVAF